MMQSIQADQAEFLRAFLLPRFENEHGVTRKVIEAIPLEKGDYRPDPASKTALELAWHIVAAEKRFLEGMAEGQFNFAPLPRPETVRNSADLGRWYGEMFRAALGRLQQASPEQLCKAVDFRGMFQMPAVMFLQVAMNHSIHHRGQLSTYLRPMGGKVPAIYGESYDSAEARKAAEAKGSK